MLKRGPVARRKAMEKYPSVLDDTITRVHDQIVELARSLPDVGAEVVGSRLADLDAARAKFEASPPEEVTRQIREPWPSEGILDAIYRMTWRVLISTGPQVFITTDNPLFFFGAYGLARPEAELCFPLSTTHALHGCWQRASLDLVFVSASQRFVKGINRRLASAAERLAFYHERASWLEHILGKEDAYLSAIKW